MPYPDETTVDLIQRFREMIRERLINNVKFHEAFDDAGQVVVEGLGSDPYPYSFDRHEVLAFLDPIAYNDELQRWQAGRDAEAHLTALECLDVFNQRPRFRDLVEVIKRKRVAPFVGAGVSVPMGYPLWGKAIAKLIAKLSVGATRTGKQHCDDALAALNSGDYVAAAEKLYAYDRTQVNQFIADTYRVDSNLTLDDVKGPLLHLPEFAEGCIITTNYDCLIEKIYEAKGKRISAYMHGSQSEHRFTPALIKGERCIMKLHGDADDNSTYVFSRSQYAKAYGKPLNLTKPLPRALRQIFVSHSLLFIGCSLDQDQTLNVFTEVSATRQFDLPQHFAFLDYPTNASSRRQKETRLLGIGIIPIWYRVKNNGTDHSELGELIHLAIDASQGKLSV